MADTSTQFVGSIPEQYDRYLGPLMFVPYAKDLAARIPELTTGTILELACGTGIVTRQLRETFPPGVKLIATDLSDSMLSYARATRALGAGVEWQLTDAQAIPQQDSSVDAVVCQFGMMFVPDKALAFREARRVLKPGGTFIFNVWAALSENPLCQVADAVIRSFYPDDPPMFYQVPFGLDDEAGLRQMLTGAGFTVRTAKRVTQTAVSPSARDVARGLVLGNPVVLAIQERGTVSPDTIVEAVTKALVKLGGETPFSSPMCALVMVAEAT